MGSPHQRVSLPHGPKTQSKQKPLTAFLIAQYLGSDTVSFRNPPPPLHTTVFQAQLSFIYKKKITLLPYVSLLIHLEAQFLFVCHKGHHLKNFSTLSFFLLLNRHWAQLYTCQVACLQGSYNLRQKHITETGKSFSGAINTLDRTFCLPLPWEASGFRSGHLDRVWSEGHTWDNCSGQKQ